MTAIRRLTLTVFAFLLLCAPANASRTMEIGLQDDAVFLGNSPLPREEAFVHAKALGVTKIRANMLWSRVLRGKQQPGPKFIASLCQALDAELSDLFEVVDDKVPA